LQQVILQKIREKEKEAIITDYKVRIGTIVNGMVLRFAPSPTGFMHIGNVYTGLTSYDNRHFRA
ncbi:MAG: glutamate--tRNA ligase family protein, partial [Anaerolineales bacterium]|nr:glutamate--tRNA ligase family protein [Anaerolineales bacterium]